jgi:hypothetical protein
MVVDKDDNLILADKSFLRMYSQNGKYIKECRLRGDACHISFPVCIIYIVVSVMDVVYSSTYTTTTTYTTNVKSVRI